ncbi:MAG: FAD-dependent thymidylate synthase [Candidatus Latescibacteria bacterium]|nr:FAD-dependent thymidylate synthase [Candidatus Latescibacterota bacterium]
MKHPEVRLITFTADAEKLICGAAKLCYAEDSATVFDHGDGEVRTFLSRLRKMGHLSPFEHASYTFLMEGVSRALTHQLVRHRIASYSQRSQRYVTHESFDFIVPPSLEGKTVGTEDGTVDAVDYYRSFMKRSAETYRNLRDALGGGGESANQDARYVLPNAVETKIMVTMNARELFHFFGERLCLRAQWEIRRTAEEMLRLAKEATPVIFRSIGPKCVQLGRCPEGKLTCGKFTEMRERYLDD